MGYNDKLVIDAAAEVSEGCPIQVDVSGSDLAHITIGEETRCFELTVDMESMRALAAASTTGIAEMDARYAREEAARG